MQSADSFNVCLTFDFDAMCVWGELFNQYSPGPVSRGEFGARVGVPRLLNVLKREEVQAAFFTPGHTIDTYPELCNQILAEGHEIGHHGYFHEGPVNLDEKDERKVLEMGLDAMDKSLGGYIPVGYRSPAWDLSANSTKLLEEYGFKYDSSLMAQDFEPYWCRTGDEMLRDRAFKFGPEIELVEIPVSWSLDDFPQLETVFYEGGFMPGFQDPRNLASRWIDEMDFAVEEIPNGVFTVTFHPQCSGRGARIRLVERLIARAKELGANLTTPGQVAKAWAEKAPERNHGQPAGAPGGG